MKNGSCSAATVAGSAVLPFVISTEAKRSGEICGPAVLSREYFSTERSVVEGPAVQQSPLGRLLFGDYCPWKRRPSLCHLDRSKAQWTDLRFQWSLLGNVFRQSEA